MATATPSSRWRLRAGWRSLRSSNRCFTDDAARSNSATPSASWTRLPTSTTRAMPVGSVLLRAPVRVGPVRGLVEAALGEGLQHLGRRHRQIGEADAGGAI